jgi:hypothetical protein
MITNIGLLFGFGLVVFLVFWLTLAVTGSATAAFWSPIVVAGIALLIRTVCAVLDSSWYWHWKHRHDHYDASHPRKPSEDKVLEGSLDPRASCGESNEARTHQLLQPDDLAPGFAHTLGPAQYSSWATSPEEFAHYAEISLEVIRQENRASTSLLQRRLNFSFQLANAMMAELERRGILGPGLGAQPREILIDLNAPL